MIARARFGRTGHTSSRVIFGGEALREANEGQAAAALELLQAHGINHIDTAPLYGESERLIGGWMRQHRSRFFLATKTLGRTYLEARDDLSHSLERLQVDAVDLWQLHKLIDPDEWATAMSPDGAFEAMLEARDQGLVRFLGVTAHGAPAASMLRRSLDRFDFDSVIVPYSHAMMQVPEYVAEFEALIAECARRDVAVQTIKAIARGQWGERPRTRNTWYEPLETQAAIDDAMHWALLRDGVFVNAVGDLELLPRVLDAAARFTGREDRETLAARLAAYSIDPLLVR